MDHEYKEQYKLKLKQLKDLEAKNYHDVSCPKCQVNILGNGININDKIAKCDACGVVFSFENEIGQLTKNHRAKQEIFRPEGIDVFQFRNEFDFTIQQPYSVLEAIIGIFGISFALLFTLFFIAKGGLFYIPAIIFWLISAYPIYSWINHSKRKINVNIDEHSIPFDEWSETS